METVVLGGVAYTRASTAAKKFGYTSDYIGQLCRGKQIDARLVGRSWYVNIDSITEYRKQKHVKRKSRKAKKKSEISINKGVNKVQVEKPLHAETVKVTETRESSRETKVPIHYQSDERELLPRLMSEQTAPVHIREVPAVESAPVASLEAANVPVYAEKSIKIKVESKKVSAAQSTLVASELPTVSLKGHIDVEDAPYVEPVVLHEEGYVEPVIDAADTKEVSKTRLFLIKLFRFVTWPLRVLLRVLWWLLHPVRYVARMLLRVLPVRKLKTLFRRTASRKPPTAPVFAPQAVAIVPRVHTPATYHSHIQFWSLLVSAFLTGLLVLSLGAELEIFAGESTQALFVDRSILEGLFSR